MVASPKTTMMAILMIAQQIVSLVMALTDGDPATNPDWASAVPIIMAAVGFLFTRDQAAHDNG